MKARRIAALAWATCAVMAVTSGVFLVLGPGMPVPNDLFGGVGGAASVLLSLTFASVGAIVAARMPGNRLGWLFLGTGMLFGATVLTYGYANYAFHEVPGELPGARAAAWFAIGPSEAIAGLLAFSLLLFPDGRLPSPRWRAAAAVPSGGIALLLVTATFLPGRLDEPFAAASNPFGLDGGTAAFQALNQVGWLLVMVGIALGAAAMVVRLRGARGEERQQLKLVLAAGAFFGAVTVLDMCIWFAWPDGRLQLRIAALGLSFAVFGIAVGIAVLRHRLYDIDLIINRALVYSVLTATLAATYVGSALLLQLALSRLTGSSGLPVALAALAVAALFRPARTRIQQTIDRRFYRRKYDAQRTLEAFAARLRDEVALDALSSELCAVVADTMQPAHVSLWLRPAESPIAGRRAPARAGTRS